MVKAKDLKAGVLYKCKDINSLWVIERLDKEGNYITRINTLISDSKIEVGSMSNVRMISSSNNFVPYGFKEYIKVCK